MKRFVTIMFIGMMTLVFAACGNETDTYDPYYNWQARNEAWYNEIANTARTNIQQAQQSYGEAWQQHTRWRMYKSLFLSQTEQTGKVTDSICVYINKEGSGKVSPIYSDSVRVSFRGWLMPTTSADGTPYELIFTQTYYGEYDANTSAPQLGAVSGFKTGFSTALQYMVKGDDWELYLPHQLFYGATAVDQIPAYSAGHFRVQLIEVYPYGTGIPDWH